MGQQTVTAKQPWAPPHSHCQRAAAMDAAQFSTCTVSQCLVDAAAAPTAANLVGVYAAVAETPVPLADPGPAVSTPAFTVAPIRTAKVGVIFSIPNPTIADELELLEAARDVGKRVFETHDNPLKCVCLGHRHTDAFHDIVGLQPTDGPIHVIVGVIHCTKEVRRQQAANGATFDPSACAALEYTWPNSS